MQNYQSKSHTIHRPQEEEQETVQTIATANKNLDNLKSHINSNILRKSTEIAVSLEHTEYVDANKSRNSATS